MTGCQDAQDLIVAYLTSSLGEQDARDLLDHLAVCDGCAGYLRDMTRAVEGLLYTLPPIKPPAHLRQRILDRIAHEARSGRPQEGGSPGADERAGHTADGAASHTGCPEPGADGPGVRRRFRYPLRARGRWRWVAAVAAVLLLGIQLHFVRQAVEENRLLRAEVAQSRQQIAAAATVLGEGVIEPEWVLRMNKGAGFEQAWGHATLYATRYGDVLVLAVGGLPQLEGGETYRAWLWGESGTAEAGDLRPDAAGFASLIVQLKDFHHRALAITREPDSRRTAAPRGPVVLSAEGLGGR